MIVTEPVSCCHWSNPREWYFWWLNWGFSWLYKPYVAEKSVVGDCLEATEFMKSLQSTSSCLVYTSVCYSLLMQTLIEVVTTCRCPNRAAEHETNPRQGSGRLRVALVGLPWTVLSEYGFPQSKPSSACSIKGLKTRIFKQTKTGNPRSNIKTQSCIHTSPLKNLSL